MTELTAILRRSVSTDQGTEGELTIPDLGWRCFTLELPWRDNAPGISCIPCGEYDCGIVDSPKFHRVYHVRAVPGRSHVLIHPGNFAGDTSKGLRSDVAGCILLGSKLGVLCDQRAVLVSRATVRRFMGRLSDIPFQLIIAGEGD